MSSNNSILIDPNRLRYWTNLKVQNSIKHHINTIQKYQLIQIKRRLSTINHLSLDKKMDNLLLIWKTCVNNLPLRSIEPNKQEI